LKERIRRGNLFVISAPSGTGKTTLCKKIVSDLPNLNFSVSYTTRPPRPGEIHDRDYSFIRRDDFMSMIEQNEFIEWAEIYGELYGTSKSRIEGFLDAGSDVILDIDVQGVLQTKKTYKGGIYIFILPPSLKILQERLEKRMTNSQEDIEKRLKSAVHEIKNYREYDYVIMNEIFEYALMELKAVITSCRLSSQNINPIWIEETYKIGG
jgi:guanylate kinase